MVRDAEYNTQRKSLQNNLASLVETDADDAIDAGKLLENVGVLWRKATLTEKHGLLVTMLEAVFIDHAATRPIVGIQSKPAFYPLFDPLKQKPNSKVTVFNPNELTEIKTDSTEYGEPDFGLVEAREGRTPRPEKDCQHFYRHSLHFNLARSASAGGV